MQAKKCDRCGVLYECYVNENNHNGFSFIRVDRDNVVNRSGTYDLCPKCMNELNEYLKGNNHDKT